MPLPLILKNQWFQAGLGVQKIPGPIWQTPVSGRVIWIDVEGQLFDTTHFPLELKEYPFAGAGCYLLYGKIVVEFGYPSIEIKKMARLPMVPDPRYEDSPVQPTAQHLRRSLRHDHQVIGRKPHPSEGEVDRLFGG